MAEAGRKIDPVVDEVTRVYDVLIRVARSELRKIGLHNPAIVMTGTGGSAEDLAAFAIFKLQKRGWAPGTGGENVLPLGRAIVKNRLIDFLRSSARKTNFSLDSAGFDKRKELQVEPEFEKLIELRSVVEKVKDRLTDEMEKKYLDALLEGARTRKEFAAYLGIPPEEVDDTQKRLKYKLERMRDLL